jgi:hypothetical protein
VKGFKTLIHAREWLVSRRTVVLKPFRPLSLSRSSSCCSLPVRPAAGPPLPRRSRRSDRHRPAPTPDLARLGLDLRADNPAQRRLRLAHIGARLPLFDVSLLLRAAPRCRGGVLLVPKTQFEANGPSLPSTASESPHPHAPRDHRFREQMASSSSHYWKRARIPDRPEFRKGA